MVSHIQLISVSRYSRQLLAGLSKCVEIREREKERERRGRETESKKNVKKTAE